MRSYKLPVACLAICLLMAACSPDSNDTQAVANHGHVAMSTIVEGPVADLEKQVMALHDSIMPSISELMQLRKAVTQTIAGATGSTKDEGLAIGSQLRQADDHMMDWMHQYKGDTLTKLSQDSALTYLKAQQAGIMQVRDQLKRSIANARAYTEKP